MNIIFFNSHTFLAKEVINALNGICGHRVLVVNIPQYPDSAGAEVIIEKLRPHFPAIVISLNDAGFDYQGVTAKRLIGEGCYIVNWYHDYPFYEEIFYSRVMQPYKNRIDFISEKSFVPEMTDRGFRAFFLPLATDPSFFHTEGDIEYSRDLAFVGNSSCEFLDSLVTEERAKELEKILPLQRQIKNLYFSNPRFDIFSYLHENRTLWEGRTELDERQLVFILEWLTGYYYRRDFVKEIARKYPTSFTCFGDPYWQNFIEPSLVSTNACYYTSLCQYYRSSRINLNINRIQIRTSFTQRVFDCAASGAFLLTDNRECNEQFFNCSGEGREIVQFDSPEQCFELIDYYLEHEQERKVIAENARIKVLQSHTYSHRLEQILETCRCEWGI